MIENFGIKFVLVNGQRINVRVRYNDTLVKAKRLVSHVHNSSGVAYSISQDFEIIFSKFSNLLGRVRSLWKQRETKKKIEEVGNLKKMK